MISETSRLLFQRSSSTVRLVSYWKVLLRGGESFSEYLMRLQLDQEVDARKSEVSSASKKTRNLRQGPFVRLLESVVNAEKPTPVQNTVLRLSVTRDKDLLQQR